VPEADGQLDHLDGHFIAGGDFSLHFHEILFGRQDHLGTGKLCGGEQLIDFIFGERMMIREPFCAGNEAMVSPYPFFEGRGITDTGGQIDFAVDEEGG